MSNMKYPTEFIQNCCVDYSNGTPVYIICKRYQVPRSTVYRWLNQHKNLSPDEILTKKSLDNMRRKQERAEQMCQILKLVNCTISSLLRIKLYELEKLFHFITLGGGRGGSSKTRPFIMACHIRKD